MICTCQSAERERSALGPARAAAAAGARGGASPERAHGFSGALWRTPLCRFSARRTLRAGHCRHQLTRTVLCRTEADYICTCLRRAVCQDADRTKALSSPGTSQTATMRTKLAGVGMWVRVRAHRTRTNVRVAPARRCARAGHDCRHGLAAHAAPSACFQHVVSLFN